MDEHRGDGEQAVVAAAREATGDEHPAQSAPK
jgi:hypothetical protein